MTPDHFAVFEQELAADLLVVAAFHPLSSALQYLHYAMYRRGQEACVGVLWFLAQFQRARHA
jgi:hypothetical protein